jgi:hypothetical protein
MTQPYAPSFRSSVTVRHRGRNPRRYSSDGMSLHLGGPLSIDRRRESEETQVQGQVGGVSAIDAVAVAQLCDDAG